MSDLIDRQAAIDALTDYWHGIQDRHKTLDGEMAVYCDCKNIIKNLTPDQPTHPNTSNTLNALDTISRQAAMEICRRMVWNGTDDYLPMSANAIENEIRQLPPVKVCETAPSDLISRQEAIYAISKDIMGGLNYERILKELPSVEPRHNFPEKAQLSGKDTTSDCISRQEAIDAVETIGFDFSDSGLSAAEIEEVCEAVGEVRQTWSLRIKRLPSAQPERKKGKWRLADIQNPNDKANGNYLYFCSNCFHADLHAKTQKVPYCWYCGAEMEDE